MMTKEKTAKKSATKEKVSKEKAVTKTAAKTSTKKKVAKEKVAKEKVAKEKKPKKTAEEMKKIRAEAVKKRAAKEKLIKERDIASAKQKSKRKSGRESTYTEAIAKEICEEVGSTTFSLKELCNRNPHWPCKQAIAKWRSKYENFGESYARAKARQADLLAEEIWEIADNESNDLIETEKGVAGNSTKVARDRLRVDTRKWIACKMLPKVYGNQRHIESLEAQNELLRKELIELRIKLDKDYKREY